MKQKAGLAIYGVVGATLLVALIAAPSVWATPGQSNHAQTVPTRTATPGPVVPTEPPPANTPVPPPPDTPQPGPTAVPPVVPSATQPVVAPTAAGSLGLTLVADRREVWPGATVTFTLTVTNSGATSLQQIVVEDVLAEGLEPGEVVSGGAAWQGRTLRLTAPALARGAQLVVVYTGRVTATDPGQAMITRATATATGGVRQTATLTLGLPPSELPATGGCVRP